MKPTLIYIDDEDINLMLFREMFKKDFDIWTTTSGVEALDYLKGKPTDFVVTDQLMPVMTGVQFLKKLREDLPDFAPKKKVMISGYTKEGEVSEALDNNLIDHFVTKPWKYEKLKELLLEE